MDEEISIISLYSNALANSVTTSVTTVPFAFAFASQEELTCAYLKAKSGLIEGISMNKSVCYVCVQYTNTSIKKLTETALFFYFQRITMRMRPNMTLK